MKLTTYLLVICLGILSGCTNYMYQGQLSASDAYGQERQFILYWPKTEQLLGTTNAGPAILLTECSTTRIDFSDQPQGIIFRGEQGMDRLPGSDAAVSDDQVCGKFLSYDKLADVPPGDLALQVDCEPIPDDFAAFPRDYLKARAEPYVFPVVEETRHWSLFGETPPAPVLYCREFSGQ